MSDLMKLCDELKTCPRKICDKKEVECVEIKLNKYVKDDISKYLKLKAEIQVYDRDKLDVLDYMLKIVALFTFLLTIINNASLADKTPYKVYAFGAMIVLFVLAVINVVYGKWKRKTEPWIRYIDVVLENIAREKGWNEKQ